MTKQEQIEEMAEAVVCGAIVANAKIDDKVAIHLKEFTENLYNAGYRKLLKGSVVLSREEICELKYQSEEDFSKAYDLGSKETAEKIFKMLISKLDSNQFLSGKRIIMEVDVENLAKQFDVEIKE